MATSLRWSPLTPLKPHIHTHSSSLKLPSRCSFRVQAFQRSDFEDFTKKVTSGKAWKDAWRQANNGFEQFVYESRKTAERIDRQYSVQRRLSAVAESAADRARELDRDFEITQRWRTFSLDFSRNWPRYRKQIGEFVETPVGKSFTTIFFLWFALSGWLFRVLIFSVWVLPFAGPLLIGAVANNFIIKGNCPSCKRQFMGNKNQIVRCAGCGNIVWQPTNPQGGGGIFGKGGRGNSPRSSKSDPDIIDVEFEEK